MQENNWFSKIEQIANKPLDHHHVEEELEADYFKEAINTQYTRIAHAFDDFETDGVFDHLIVEIRKAIVSLESDLPASLPSLCEDSLDKLYVFLSKKINALESKLPQEQHTALRELARSFFETTRNSPEPYDTLNTEVMDKELIASDTYEAQALEEFVKHIQVSLNQITLAFDEYEAGSAHKPESMLLRHVRRICESLAYEWQRLPNENSDSISKARTKAYSYYHDTMAELVNKIHSLEQRGDASEQTIEQLKQLFETIYQPPAWIAPDNSGSSDTTN